MAVKTDRKKKRNKDYPSPNAEPSTNHARSQTNQDELPGRRCEIAIHGAGDVSPAHPGDR